MAHFQLGSCIGYPTTISIQHGCDIFVRMPLAGRAESALVLELCQRRFWSCTADMVGQDLRCQAHLSCRVSAIPRVPAERIYDRVFGHLPDAVPRVLVAKGIQGRVGLAAADVVAEMTAQNAELAPGRATIAAVECQRGRQLLRAMVQTSLLALRSMNRCNGVPGAAVRIRRRRIGWP